MRLKHCVDETLTIIEASAEYDCRIMWLIEANSAWSISVRCPLNKLFCVYSVWLYHHLFYILKPTL